MGGSRKASGLQRDSLRGGSKGLTQQRITQEPGQDRREREWRGWVWKGQASQGQETRDLLQSQPPRTCTQSCPLLSLPPLPHPGAGLISASNSPGSSWRWGSVHY